jgi:catechol 2,3-dioxygenase-like lactoylglutathione lyase family enzyme
MKSDDQNTFLGIGHVTVPVKDLELAEQFYIGLLGGSVLMRIDANFLERVGRPSDPRAFHTSVTFGSETRLDLFLQDEGQPPAWSGHPHIAIRVRPESLMAKIEKLREHGIPVDGPNRLGPPGQASAYFNDPFGNHLEFETHGYEGEVKIGPPDMARLVHNWTG